MTNLIQIKRSLANPGPPSLSNGELAYTANGNVLFVGSPNGSVVSIGGLRTPGTLTANQALVANSTSGINEIRVGTANVGALYANGSLGTAGHVLHSNGTAVYWDVDNAGITQVNTGIGLTGGPITTTGTVSVLANNGITANSTGIFVAAGTGTVVNATGVHVNSAFIGTLTANNANNLNGNPASFYTNATNLATGTVPTARLGTGTANTSTFLRGDQTYATAVTSVGSGNGLTGGPITTTGSLSVLANNGIVSNSTGVFVRAGTGVTVNATGVHIGQAVGTTDSVTFNQMSATGNTVLGDAVGDVVSINGSVNTNIMPIANITYNIGNNTMRWAEVHTGNVHSTRGYFEGDVQISGNLVVLGTSVSVNTTNLIVQDPLIHLASNNDTSDLVDIGFFGNYNADSGPVEYTGMFRDASDDTFKLFKGLQVAPVNIVNTTAAGFTIASLQAFMISSGLTTNATHVSITANSTVDVSIVANTLTLATALAGTSGGTGRSTIADNAILVGNSTNGYNQLSLGTDGQVLQSNGTALVYDILDGGTF